MTKPQKPTDDKKPTPHARGGLFTETNAKVDATVPIIPDDLREALINHIHKPIAWAKVGKQEDVYAMDVEKTDRLAEDMADYALRIFATQTAQNEKSPEGLSSDSLTLNEHIVTQVRQELLDLLSEYRELDKPANPELLKLFIEARENRILALFATRTAQLEYDHRVAENVRLVANSKVFSTWLDPVTNNKVYNEAAFAQLKERLLQAIGENEPVSNKLTGGNKANYKFIICRNKLRATQRAAVEEVFKET